MPPKNPLPDNVPELASILISVGMDERGVGTGYTIDGMSDEEALGRLISIQEAIKAKLAHKWDDFDDDFEEGDEEEVILVCPHCDTPVTYGDLDERNN